MLLLCAAARDDLKPETRRNPELTHPNIVRIYDFMEDDSAAAISMEYVDAPTLSQLRVARASRAFEPAEIEPSLGGLCAALGYPHGTTRMVHHDLKPANLMLNERGMVRSPSSASRAASWVRRLGSVSIRAPPGRLST
jgi:serine/threonine protein kinase